MLQDSLMFLSGIFLFLLFSFLLVTNLVVFASFFVRNKKQSFQPRVSIIIPAHNEEKNIKECLKSIFESEYPANKLEVILVNDGSTDNTENIAREFKNARIINNCHKGKASALNIGVKHARFDFVIIIDADTIIDKDCIKNIVIPMKEPDVGAVAGVLKVKNKHSLLGMFQNVEYFYTNLIRKSFSKLFGNTVWFHSAIACYRKSALAESGFFKPHTLSEDWDASMSMYAKGYRSVLADANAKTTVPDSVYSLIVQRMRWGTGVFQCINKHKHLFKSSSSPSILFLFINQWWWSFFAAISFPLFFLQILYWLPQGSTYELLMYFVRWFSLLGPAYVVYNLPEWGFSFYNFFGVFAGIMTLLVMILAIKLFNEKLLFRNAFALFFYFPYTILLNMVIIFSIIRYKFYKPAFFIR